MGKKKYIKPEVTDLGGFNLVQGSCNSGGFVASFDPCEAGGIAGDVCSTGSRVLTKWQYCGNGWTAGAGCVTGNTAT